MVLKEQIPNTKGIRNALPSVDFSDTFSTTNCLDSLEKIGGLIFNNPPKWIISLFVIRNFMVKIVGLKTTKPVDYSTRFEVGGYIGFFRIYEILEDELILGADDKHLNFRVSIFNSQENQYNIKVTTLVEFNNRLGKIYMFIVHPFHRVVVRRMVKNAYLVSV